MEENLEKKLRKTALISGLTLKAAAWTIAYHAGKEDFMQQEYLDSIIKATIYSTPAGLTANLLLGYAGVSYGKSFFSKSVKPAAKNITVKIKKGYDSVMGYRGYLERRANHLPKPFNQKSKLLDSEKT